MTSEELEAERAKQLAVAKRLSAKWQRILRAITTERPNEACLVEWLRRETGKVD